MTVSMQHSLALYAIQLLQNVCMVCWSFAVIPSNCYFVLQLSGTWIKLADYPFARGDFALATLPGNRLLAVGGEMNGRGRTNAQTQASHQVNEYIGDHDIWVPKVPIPGPRFRMDAAYVDGVVYVFGGHAVCVGQDCPETATTQAYFDFDHPDIFLLQAE